ncbi:helix-turn-helix domain-containing protein [Amycolatopsis japonica]|uniref:helix-turn-helix domain-containing protein n=1 Tax=Amycolatopsis japonica TaxID=208439 RepID=UPI0011DE58BE|nr:helix-turn-helix domain-containing protein [Amycolatopsis japonica]
MPPNEVPGESDALERRRAAARRRLKHIRKAREDEPAAVLEAVNAGIEKNEIAALLGVTRQTVRMRLKSGNQQGTAGQSRDFPNGLPAGDGGEAGESPTSTGPRKQADGEPSPGTGTPESSGSEPSATH